MSTGVSIPLIQRAFVLSQAGGELRFDEKHPVVQPAELKPGQCLVRLTHAGVCHTDLALRRAEFPNKPKDNLVGGHEGIGIVVAIGEHTQDGAVKIGDRVGIKFIGNTCMNCEMCRKGFEGREHSPFPFIRLFVTVSLSNHLLSCIVCYNLQSSGGKIDGTFCEYSVSYVNHVIPIPDALDSPTAATIMCAVRIPFDHLRYISW